MKSYSYFFVVLSLVFVLLGSSCAAVQMAPVSSEVLHIAPGSVLYGIKACLGSQPGTSIFTDGKHYLFVWAYKDMQAVGFFGLDYQGNSVNLSKVIEKGGNLVNSVSIKDIISNLQRNGWTTVDPSSFSTVLATVIGSRIASSPVVIFSVSVFGEEGNFEQWFNDTFTPVEVIG
jgi:hypothetical protein